MDSTHLPFLDGIRGLAALYVTLFHLTSVTPHENISPWIRAAVQPLYYGHYAVGVFIVLSGYLLMLPVVRSEDGKLRGGLYQFFLRRGRRILIPYYAALVLSIPPEMLRVRLHHEAFPWDALVAHVLLIHNIRLDWLGSINGPLWTVVVEWQIYFIFALIFLPVWRRAGIYTVVVLSFILSALLCVAYSYCCPWYISLFALGMLAAQLTFTQSAVIRNRVSQIPWGLLALLFFIGLVVSINSLSNMIYSDVLLGFASCFFIIYCVLTLRKAEEYPNRTLLSLRAIRWLGNPMLVALSTFSYSLYLVHFPVISCIDTIFKRYLHIHSENVLMGLQIVIVLPACLSIAYGFSLLFEKPFMGSRKPPSVIR